MIEITARPVLSEDKEMTEAVKRALANPAAFRPIYESYFRRIYHYCLRRVRSPQEAEDLTSLIFTRALAGLGSYRGGSFAAWHFRIAHNTVLNHIRSRRMTLPLEDAETLSDSEPVSDNLIKAEEREHMDRLVSSLPEEQRELITLKAVGGLSAKEIGEVMGKSEGAVRVAIHRIVRQLRTAWVEEGAR